MLVLLNCHKCAADEEVDLSGNSVETFVGQMKERMKALFYYLCESCLHHRIKFIEDYIEKKNKPSVTVRRSG